MRTIIGLLLIVLLFAACNGNRKEQPGTKTVFDAKEKELKSELASLKDMEDVKSADWLPEVVKQFNLAVEVSEIFKSGSLEDKKEALSILGSNLTLDAGNVTVYNAKTVEALMGGLFTVRSANPEFEPRNIVDTSSSNPVFAPQFCRLLRRQDSNLRPMR